MKRPIKDVAASVRQRLQNNAKETGRPFQEVLQYFAMERFLYRLSRSPHAGKFILKGALMLTAWRAPSSRSTRDIDLLAHMKNDIDAVVDVVRAVCKVDVEADGLEFAADTVQGIRIKEDADYHGVRVTFTAFLQNARVPMQIDIGFGDTVFPAAVEIDYPTILDHPAPRLRGYCRETSIAEKFEAMVHLGQLNSRLKDFYDIWLLSRQYDFHGPTLLGAIARTFENRDTLVPDAPLAFSPAFVEDPTKITQWKAYLKKSKITGVPEDFSQLVKSVAEFLMPVVSAIHAKEPFESTWPPAGPWRVN